MGPKQNAKAVAGNAKKAEVQKQKDAVKQAAKDAQEAAEWGKGAKDGSKKEQEEAKRQEALRKKAEREALLAEEEASIKSAKSSNDKLANKREAKNDLFAKESGANVQKFAASGLDDALDLLSIVAEGKGPSEVQGLDRHPERRYNILKVLL